MQGVLSPWKGFLSLLPCVQLAALSAREAGSAEDAEDGEDAVLAAAAAAHQLLLALCTDPALGLLPGAAGEGGEWDATGSGSSAHPGALCSTLNPNS